MLDIQATRFWQVAIQSGLLDRPGLEACLEAIPAEKRTADAIDRRLARQAISTGRITLWQAQQLLSGRANGFRIDKYLLLDRIGQGGMGRVYLAKDTRLHRRVALKVLAPDRMNNPRAIARFQREAKVGAQLQHDNLVRIYDEGECNGIRYLVMEYIEGKNVGQMIQNGPIPWQEASRIARQVALGLEHAYQKGLIHRDVNPCNILISLDGVAKLTDLGLAIDLADDENVTRDGATVGTFDYISPEQARHSRSVTTRSDIYSLGCSLYHMICGRVPFPNASLPEKLFAHQSREPDALPELIPDVPESLWQVIRKMIRKRPEERYATPLSVAQALEPFADPAIGPQAMAEAGDAALAAIAGSEVAAYEEPVATEPSPAPVTASAPVPVGAATPLALASVPQPSPVAVAAPMPLAAHLELATTPVTPDPLGAASSMDLGGGMGLLPLDLGPDDPLTAGLLTGTRSRSISRSRSSSKSDETSAKAAPSRRGRLAVVLGSIGVVAIVGLAGTLYLTMGWGGTGGGTQPGTKTGSGSRPAANAPVAVNAPAPDQPRPPAPAEGISVVYRDGLKKPATSLAEALSMAAGARSGEVVLSGAKPIVLSNQGKPIELASGGVILRAEAGTRPTLILEVGGPNPFLKTTGLGRLTLKGIRVEARYASSARVVRELFEVGGELVVEHCAFLAASAPADAVVFKVDGLKATIKGCFFDGFDQALNVAVFPRSLLSLSDTMVVYSGRDVKAGWGVKLRASTAGASAATKEAQSRRVVLDRCTFQGRGVFQLSGFTAATPLEIEARRLAVQADAILAFDADAAVRAVAPPGFAAIRWTGGDNLYDIQGDAWVAISTSLLVKAGGLPADWDAWSGWTKETGSKSEDIQFKTPAGQVGESPRPEDYALPLPAQKGFGAEPPQVGLGTN